MNLAEKAYKELYPEKILDRKIELKYSRRFKSYNANVRYNPKKIIFSLSNDWKDVFGEIQIGLIQSLLLKIFKEKRKTINMELYDKFIKNIPKFSIPTNVDLVLEESFDRMNKKYFFDFLEKPNLVWGQESFRKLGSYEYATDTIIISKVLKGEKELLDYVMHHEMLHKKLKFNSKNGRNYHHTSEFKKREKEFEDKEIEKKLTAFLRKKRLRKAFRFF
ncbi:MAG: SprT-like domain-containing protein [Nanoarchaeota archaeon]|nr:SprT-like domain-containing protein [DPANN group archaeon]MBL7116335.1 SprT-like domain-containing protein [Nanoarchaeota archaeon]